MTRGIPRGFGPVLFAWLLTGVCVSAVSVVWDGGAGTSNWCDANNWSGDAIPVSGSSDVTISGASVTSSAACAFGVQSLALDAGAALIVVVPFASGNELNFGAQLLVSADSTIDMSGAGGAAIITAGALTFGAGTNSIFGASQFSGTSLTCAGAGAYNSVRVSGQFVVSGTTAFTASSSLAISASVYNPSTEQTIDYGSTASVLTLAVRSGFSRLGSILGGMSSGVLALDASQETADVTVTLIQSAGAFVSNFSIIGGTTITTLTSAADATVPWSGQLFTVSCGTGPVLIIPQHSVAVAPAAMQPAAFIVNSGGGGAASIYGLAASFRFNPAFMKIDGPTVVAPLTTSSTSAGLTCGAGGVNISSSLSIGRSGSPFSRVFGSCRFRGTGAVVLSNAILALGPVFDISVLGPNAGEELQIEMAESCLTNVTRAIAVTNWRGIIRSTQLQVSPFAGCTLELNATVSGSSAQLILFQTFVLYTPVSGLISLTGSACTFTIGSRIDVRSNAALVISNSASSSGTLSTSNYGVFAGVNSTIELTSTISGVPLMIVKPVAGFTGFDGANNKNAQLKLSACSIPASSPSRNAIGTFDRITGPKAGHTTTMRVIGQFAPAVTFADAFVGTLYLFADTSIDSPNYADFTFADGTSGELILSPDVIPTLSTTPNSTAGYVGAITVQSVGSSPAVTFRGFRVGGAVVFTPVAAVRTVRFTGETAFTPSSALSFTASGGLILDCQSAIIFTGAINQLGGDLAFTTSSGAGSALVSGPILWSVSGTLSATSVTSFQLSSVITLSSATLTFTLATGSNAAHVFAGSIVGTAAAVTLSPGFSSATSQFAGAVMIDTPTVTITGVAGAQCRTNITFSGSIAAIVTVGTGAGYQFGTITCGTTVSLRMSGTAGSAPFAGSLVVTAPVSITFRTSVAVATNTFTTSVSTLAPGGVTSFVMAGTAQFIGPITTAGPILFKPNSAQISSALRAGGDVIVEGPGLLINMYITATAPLTLALSGNAYLAATISSGAYAMNFTIGTAGYYGTMTQSEPGGSFLMNGAFTSGPVLMQLMGGGSALTFAPNTVFSGPIQVGALGATITNNGGTVSSTLTVNADTVGTSALVVNAGTWTGAITASSPLSISALKLTQQTSTTSNGSITISGLPLVTCTDISTFAGNGVSAAPVLSLGAPFAGSITVNSGPATFAFTPGGGELAGVFTTDQAIAIAIAPGVVQSNTSFVANGGATLTVTNSGNPNSRAVIQSSVVDSISTAGLMITIGEGVTFAGSVTINTPILVFTPATLVMRHKNSDFTGSILHSAVNSIFTISVPAAMQFAGWLRVTGQNSMFQLTGHSGPATVTWYSKVDLLGTGTTLVFSGVGSGMYRGNVTCTGASTNIRADPAYGAQLGGPIHVAAGDLKVSDIQSAAQSYYRVLNTATLTVLQKTHTGTIELNTAVSSPACALTIYDSAAVMGSVLVLAASVIAINQASGGSLTSDITATYPLTIVMAPALTVSPKITTSSTLTVAGSGAGAVSFTPQWISFTSNNAAIILNSLASLTYGDITIGSHPILLDPASGCDIGGVIYANAPGLDLRQSRGGTFSYTYVSPKLSSTALAISTAAAGSTKSSSAAIAGNSGTGSGTGAGSGGNTLSSTGRVSSTAAGGFEITGSSTGTETGGTGMDSSSSVLATASSTGVGTVVSSSGSASDHLVLCNDGRFAVSCADVPTDGGSDGSIPIAVIVVIAVAAGILALLIVLGLRYYLRRAEADADTLHLTKASPAPTPTSLATPTADSSSIQLSAVAIELPVLSPPPQLSMVDVVNTSLGPSLHARDTVAPVPVFGAGGGGAILMIGVPGSINRGLTGGSQDHLGHVAGDSDLVFRHAKQCGFAFDAESGVTNITLAACTHKLSSFFGCEPAAATSFPLAQYVVWFAGHAQFGTGDWQFRKSQNALLAGLPLPPRADSESELFEYLSLDRVMSLWANRSAVKVFRTFLTRCGLGAALDVPALFQWIVSEVESRPEQPLSHLTIISDCCYAGYWPIHAATRSNEWKTVTIQSSCGPAHAVVDGTFSARFIAYLSGQHPIHTLRDNFKTALCYSGNASASDGSSDGSTLRLFIQPPPQSPQHAGFSNGLFAASPFVQSK